METGVREYSSGKQKSTMLNGAMIRMQRIHCLSNKEANGDLVRIISVACWGGA